MQTVQTHIKFSILIICRKQSELKSSDQIRQLNSGNYQYEVLVAEGDNPSLQRNELAQKAEGDYLLFFDGDSIPDKNILNCYLEILRLYPGAKIAGGPSVLDEKQDRLSVLSRLFFSTAFGLGPCRSRYLSSGEIRQTDERELILCNLMIEKSFFLLNKGFDKNIYPNEENELLKRVKNKYPEIPMVFHPGAIVHREPRQSLYEFSRQMYAYGQGRSKHNNLRSEPRDIIFFIPTFFIIYLLLVVASPGHSAFGVLLIPLVTYVFLGILHYVLAHPGSRFSLSAVLSPFFFLIGHVSYGVGFGVGLVKYSLVKKIFFKERKITLLNIQKLKKFTNI